MSITRLVHHSALGLIKEKASRHWRRNYGTPCFHPLSERTSIITTDVKLLLNWRNDQLRDLATYETMNISELKLELNWLIEDAFVGIRNRSSFQYSVTNFQSFLLSFPSSQDENKDEECVLKASLGELDTLWRKRIKNQVPIQYLTQGVHWRDLKLAIGPGVLIPRPETEQLVDLAQCALHSNPELSLYPWVDLGCGSGAIGLALAKIIPQLKILAVDKSPVCIKCAQVNAERLGLSERVQTLQGDWYEPLFLWKGQIGGIISNPPYIPSSQIPTLQAEVSNHEPHLALDGGCELGIKSLKTIISQAEIYLRPGGYLALETNGSDQSERLKYYIEEERNDNQLKNVQILEDYYGIRRFITALNMRSFY